MSGITVTVWASPDRNTDWGSVVPPYPADPVDV